MRLKKYEIHVDTQNNKQFIVYPYIVQADPLNMYYYVICYSKEKIMQKMKKENYAH